MVDANKVGDKVETVWNKAIVWVDGHPKTTLIVVLVLAGLGVIGWIV